MYYFMYVCSDPSIVCLLHSVGRLLKLWLPCPYARVTLVYSQPLTFSWTSAQKQLQCSILRILLIWVFSESIGRGSCYKWVVTMRKVTCIRISGIAFNPCYFSGGTTYLRLRVNSIGRIKLTDTDTLSIEMANVLAVRILAFVSDNCICVLEYVSLHYITTIATHTHLYPH